MSSEGFEPPTFGSGIRRAAVAPWARAVFGPGRTFVWTAPRRTRAKNKQTPPLGIEPRTCRLTADRSANGALEAQSQPQGASSASAAVTVHKIIAKWNFPVRDLNLGLVGESHLS